VEISVSLSETAVESHTTIERRKVRHVIWKPHKTPNQKERQPKSFAKDHLRILGQGVLYGHLERLGVLYGNHIYIVMSKHIWKIWIPITTLIILIVAYGSYRLWQYRTHSHRLDKAITGIIDTLSSDPNYFVTERIVIKATEPNFLDFDYLNQGLQVCVRKGLFIVILILVQ
jgi:hypothetical protein